MNPSNDKYVQRGYDVTGTVSDVSRVTAKQSIKKKKIVNNKLHKHRFRQLPGDIERLASASVAPEGALRWRAGLTGPSRSSWLGRAGLVCTTVGAGVIETEGARCMRSTGSGMRGGRSA